MRHAVLGTLFYIALLADLHQPTWGFCRLQPSFLDAMFLLAVQVCGATGAVVWGGLAGFLEAVIHGRSPSAGILLQSTLGLGIGILLSSKARHSLFFLLSLSLLSLTVMNAVRLKVWEQIPTQKFLSLTVGQIALTFLAIIVCSILINLWSPRRSNVGW